VNLWLIAAAAFMILAIPASISVLRGEIFDRLVALELIGILYTFGLICLAEGFDRDVYFIAAVAFAALSFGSNLIYVRFLERRG
jgi:multisubunit Na+/H+ antiporter MnhF subunit